MDISIVIPSYNTQDTIATTLAKLHEQQTLLHYEIILVDCSSHDEVQKITNRFAKVRYEHRTQRFNPGEGRNIGAHLAQGELLIFVDADVHLAPNALEAAWKSLRSGKDVFGGALELNTEASDNIASYLEHYFFNHESQALRPAGERNNLSSALMCFRRETFLASGGFKDIPRMQDTELTERLRHQGQKLYFCPDILGLQIQDSAFNKVLKKIYINGQNLYYIRYKPRITPLKKASFYLLLPAIGAVKIARIIGRHLVYQNGKNKLRTLALTPVLILGICYWTAGFYNALWTEKGIGKDR
jgi:glycosyltransferase involved in cell wall biosynthesis